MKTLLDKIMNVLTRYDESTSAYITPTQEPFVRKELEEVVKQFEQADGIVRRLAECWCSDSLTFKPDTNTASLVEQAQHYTQSHPAQVGEKKEGE